MGDQERVEAVRARHGCNPLLGRQALQTAMVALRLEQLGDCTVQAEGEPRTFYPHSMSSWNVSARGRARRASQSLARLRYTGLFFFKS